MRGRRRLGMQSVDLAWVKVDDAWAFPGQSIGRRRRQWALGRPIGLL